MPQHYQKSYISSLPDVLVIFALITILGNTHRPCEQYPNIVSNCPQHAYSFPLIIPYFLIIFTLLTILGNAHRACKQHTNIVDDGLHRISLFFSDFFWFSGYIYLNYHIRKCAQTMWTIPQHCQQLSTASLFFSSYYSWFSH